VVTWVRGRGATERGDAARSACTFITSSSEKEREQVDVQEILAVWDLLYASRSEGACTTPLERLFWMLETNGS
jgi:hypothetical protein